MSRFAGFPDNTDYTPVPAAFVTQLMPEIRDPVELRVCLFLFSLLAKKRGYPRYVLRSELLAARPLLVAVGGAADGAKEAVNRGLDLAVERGTVLALPILEGPLGAADGQEVAYFLNTPASRRAMEQVKVGTLSLGVGLRPRPVEEEPSARPSNIFALYEENIGVLTPIIAEQLKDAEATYPPGWVEDAIRVTVSLNKRSWATVAKILHRWERDGKDDGQPWRHPSQTKDPDRFVKGRYGHIFRR